MCEKEEYTLTEINLEIEYLFELCYNPQEKAYLIPDWIRERLVVLWYIKQDILSEIFFNSWV